ncbi:hypothetical protein [Chitinophaga filiformis]|uniref:DUF3805 domain-containing protein n=1 Tax=Chitinophaga filiformis TaxID=104663 RepID=A0ABY4HXV3_CHIFI|nr:hypothetical protein [Chitinophaga filiformis]UPK67974.1 hypothetical protein MYF79_23765 [Chitinophaga filiformis]
MEYYNYKNTNLNFLVPNDWELDQTENNLITMYNYVNSLGVLQFSVYYPPDAGSVSLKNELIDFVSDNHNDFDIHEGKHYVYTDYLLEENGSYMKYWVIRKDEAIIFGTYNCDKEQRGLEEKVVDEIIEAI